MSLLIPAILGIVTAAVLTAIIYLFIKRSRSITEVLLCRPRNRTGDSIRIENDFAETMETNLDRKPAPLFFWKYRGGYAFNDGGHIVRRSFAREGSAYIKELEGGSVDVPLHEAVKAKVGQEFYSKIPEPQRRQLENPKILVTVDLENPDTPEGYQQKSAEDVYAEGDRKAARIYNTEMKEETKSTKGRLVDVLLGAALAAAIIMLAVSMGWIGGSHAAPAANVVASMVTM